MDSSRDLRKIATLLSERNRINKEIAKLIQRPALQGHIGEYIAAKIFNIKLEHSATAQGIDGIFQNNNLNGKTVNIKLYGKRENILDIKPSQLADYYLVLTGPKKPASNSMGETRPVKITNVYLFDIPELIMQLKPRKIKIGVATSVANRYWEAAEIYPKQKNRTIYLTEKQKQLLTLFKP